MSSSNSPRKWKLISTPRNSVAEVKRFECVRCEFTDENKSFFARHNQQSHLRWHDFAEPPFMPHIIPVPFFIVHYDCNAINNKRIHSQRNHRCRSSRNNRSLYCERKFSRAHRVKPSNNRSLLMNKCCSQTKDEQQNVRRGSGKAQTTHESKKNKS